MDPWDEDNTGSQEILVAFWTVLMGVLVVMWAGVMYIHHKTQQSLHRKLYNFKKAPKNYVEEDSFINPTSHD